MSQLNFGEIKTESTGFGNEVVARVNLHSGADGLHYAIGEDEYEAVQNLRGKLEACGKIGYLEAEVQHD